MFRSWRIGTAFGIPLYVHPTFLILPLLLLIRHFQDGWDTVVFAECLLVAVFSCVLLHELGHALTARRFGIKPVDITLYPIGGVARLNRLASTPTEELVIAVAGPAVNVVIALLLMPFFIVPWMSILMTTGSPSVPEGWFTVYLSFVVSLWLANVVLVLFNMLPTFPMDGGRVLRALLSYRFSLVRATEVAVFTGRVVTGILFLLILALVPSLLLQNPLILVVAFFVLFAGYRELVMVRRMASPPEELPEVEVLPAPGRAYEDVFAQGTPTPDYSGFTWDQERRVCVHWLNGQPVGVFFIPAGSTRPPFLADGDRLV